MLWALEQAGFQTLLPAVVSSSGPLAFRRYQRGDALVAGPLARIPEPPASREETAPDILFAPCSAFDRSGQRIGYGRGFYDATLASLRARGEIVAIAVAFACQEVEDIPGDRHDQALDAVITEREILFCTAAGRALDATFVHR